MVKLPHHLKKALHKSTPTNILRAQRTRQIIKRFADELGMVYFGYVDQHDDDYRLIRGLTASRSHEDNHYTVGSFKGYDISFVVRRDLLKYADQQTADQDWLIMTFDLKTEYELPHFYIMYHKHQEQLKTKFTTLTEMPRSSFVGHEPRFFDLYTIYGKLEKLQEKCQLISPAMSQGMFETFGDMSVEVSENTLYLYRTGKYPDRSELERILRAGLWMSQTLDESARECYVRFD